MNRLSKLVAVLALSGVVASPASMPLAHSACRLSGKSPAPGCHSAVGRQSGSMRRLQAADRPCCRIAPALPAQSTTYVVVDPMTSLTAFNVALPGLVLQRTRRVDVNLLHSPAHGRRQAVLCTFLI